MSALTTAHAADWLVDLSLDDMLRMASLGVISPSEVAAVIVEQGVQATADPADYLPATALRIYEFVSQNGPSTLYAVKRGTGLPDGLAVHSWLMALEDVGLLRLVPGASPAAWRTPITGAPEDYLPAPALKIYRFLQENGPSTLAQVRKANPLPGFGVLSWLLCLKDIGLASQDTTVRDFTWSVIA